MPVNNNRLNEYLLEVLRSHGIQAQHFGEWVALDETGPALRGLSFINSKHENQVIIQLDIQVALPDGRLLVESFGAFGESENKALLIGFNKFLKNSFHTIISVFFNYKLDEQIELEQWTLRGETWNLYINGMTIEVGPQPENNGNDAEIPEFKPPENLISTLEPIAEQCNIENADLHWFRGYVFVQDGKVTTIETLWDGMVWSEATKLLEKMEWPPYQGRYSMRIFLILQRTQAKHKYKPGWDYRTILSQTAQLAQLYRDHPEMDEDQIHQELVRIGVDPELASHLIVFSPIAYSKTLFHKLALPDTYQIRGMDEQLSSEKPLEVEPAFLAARDMAQKLVQKDREQFMAVAQCCSIFNVISQALKDGYTMEDLKAAKFAPLVVSLGQ